MYYTPCKPYNKNHIIITYGHTCHKPVQTKTIITGAMLTNLAISGGKHL